METPYRADNLTQMPLEHYMGLLKTADASEISDWADEAMHWCVMHGILTGTDRGLEPKATATDGQLDLVLERWRKAAQQC